MVLKPDGMKDDRKKFWLFAVDPGFQKNFFSKIQKEIFRVVKDVDMTFIMWSAALNPGCLVSEYQFSFEAAKKEWEHLIDEYVNFF